MRLERDEVLELKRLVGQFNGWYCLVHLPGKPQVRVSGKLILGFCSSHREMRLGGGMPGLEVLVRQRRGLERVTEFVVT